MAGLLFKTIRFYQFFLIAFTISCCFENSAVVDARASSKTNRNNNEVNDLKVFVENWIARVRDQYDAFPDKGKLVTGFSVGFGTSKLVVRSAVKFVKLAGAVFVATELLEATGILNIDNVFDDTDKDVTKGARKSGFKRKLLNKISDLRLFIRNKLDDHNFKKWIEKDR